MFLASFDVLGPFDKSSCQNWLKLASKYQKSTLYGFSFILMFFLLNPFVIIFIKIKYSLNNVCILHVNSIYKVCYISIIISVLLVSLFNQISCLVLKKSFSVMGKKKSIQFYDCDKIWL